MHFFSTNYEMTEEQVLSTLQTIFAVKLPQASETCPSANMDLPDTANLLKLKSEEKSDTNNGAITATKSSLETYNELISDILTEVLMNMAKGKT